MLVFETINSLTGGDLGAAVEIYYTLIGIVAQIIAIYVKAHFVCNGCLIAHVSQLQHQCLTMDDEDKVYSLFHEAVEESDEERILDEWYSQLTEVDFDVLYLPDLWKEDDHFMNDIASSATRKYGSETD